MAISGLDFTAIDFETANGARSSACAVGMIKVRNGEVVDRFSSLLRPIDGGGFNSMNIAVHGIHEIDVRFSPTWIEIWPEVNNFVGRDSLVAHNASFDRSVWRRTCEASEIYGKLPNFYCTMKMAKRYLAIPSVRLPLVAQALNVPDFQHHDATADAQACALIGIEFAQLNGMTCVEQFDGLRPPR